MFRPKVKLLTRKEYIDQGRVETKKALEELRGYCSSPECKPWKTVLKLKNPTRLLTLFFYSVVKIKKSLHFSR